MKYSIPVKFLAVALCAAMLVGAIGSGIGLIFLANLGIENAQNLPQIHEDDVESSSAYYARIAARYWASGKYGEMPEALVQYNLEHHIGSHRFQVTVMDENGRELFSNFEGTSQKEYAYHFDNLTYEQFLQWGNINASREKYPNMDWNSVSVYGISSERNSYSYRYSCIEHPLELSVAVTVHYLEDTPEYASMWAVVTLLAENQNWLIVGVIGGLLLFALTAVYLCVSAGHKPGREEIRAGGFNALPLDLYAAAIIGCVCLGIAVLEELDYSLDFITQSQRFLILLFGTMGFGVCLLFVGWCFAVAAQVKMPHTHWWWNTVTGRCLRLGMRIVKWSWQLVCKLAPKLFALVIRLIKDLWKIILGLLTLVYGFWLTIWRKWLPWVGRRFERFFNRLPLTWQWLGGGLVCMVLLRFSSTAYGFTNRAVWLALFFLLVLYGAYCFGTLLEAAKRLRSGELDSKVHDRYLIGSFREFAQELNGVADVAMVAARKQLKSERMKTELITNVSHDIKTPLTSIINYVDLLEKPHTPEEEKAYLEVLSRQSQRMKKLIEDLMEMSKASTGNTPVEITRIDAVEAVNQALGEFTDKLASAGLTPVFHHPESVYLMADGRLLWRSMSNILSNAVKYALPGTRFYVDVASLEDCAVISFKNISGDQLNISADELMERFVRGDSSRNTEGSGLGLNIAKSLMELQGGQLQLLVDGDLFKVTLVFPKAE